MKDTVQTTFRDIPVRMVDDDPPTLVLKDVADALGYRAPDLKRSIKGKYLKGVENVHTPGGPQKMTCVTRPGISQALATLKPQSTEKQEAVESFQDWLYEDLLEEVYNTGSYNAEPDVPAEYADDPIIQMRRDQLKAKRERKEMKSEISELREERDEARKQLAEAREPEVDIPEKGVQSEINDLVRSHAFATGDYSAAYRRLYKTYRQRAGIDLSRRANNRVGDVSALDVADELGVLEEVYRVAYDLYA